MRRHRTSSGFAFSVLTIMLAASAAVILATGCEVPPAEEEPVVRPVKILTIGAAAGPGTREYPGEIRASEQSEVAFEVADEALQFMGGYGYMMEYPVQRAWRDARLGRIGGGTDEIMREIIATSMGLYA